MRYVMMDTNIFLDMIIDRKNNISGKLIRTFIKLLDFNEVKLIIPAIVVYETYKHLEEQLEEVGKKINEAKKSLKDIYGINGFELFDRDIKEFKDSSTKKLTTIYEKFNNDKGNYLDGIEKIIKKIFEHSNSKIVEDTEELRNLCLKRRIYKRAPFHIEKKESYADGLIVETLVNILDYIDVKDSNTIVFVTRNTSDFSKKSQKKELHEDIQADLEKTGLRNRVQYVTSFGELVGVVLDQEVRDANLKEEFDKEMQEQEEMFKEQSYVEFKNLQRESVGLTALSDFENMFLEKFCNSSFVMQLKNLFLSMKDYQNKLDDIIYFYNEELQDYINEIEVKGITELIERWNDLMLNLHEIPICNRISGIREIFDWITKKVKSNDYPDFHDFLPYTIEYGDSITIYGAEKQEYRLTMDELYLSCDSGNTDSLNIFVYNDGNQCAAGSIEIKYGCVSYDVDGGIGDFQGEDISFNTNEIVDCIKKIVEEFGMYIEEESDIVDKIRDTFGIIKNV